MSKNFSDSSEPYSASAGARASFSIFSRDTASSLRPAIVPSGAMRNSPGVCIMPYFIWKSESISGSHRWKIRVETGEMSIWLCMYFIHSALFLPVYIAWKSTGNPSFSSMLLSIMVSILHRAQSGL